MIVLAVIAALIICALACGIIAGRRGYDRGQFMIAGFLSGPFAVNAALRADQYEPAPEEDEEEVLELPVAPDGEELAPAPVIDEEETEQETQPEVERPAPPRRPAPPARPPAPAPQPEPEPPSLVELAKMRPTTTVRTSLVEGSLDWKEPKRGKLPIGALRGQDDDQEETYEEFELTPVAPGTPTGGICPHCEQESYSDWYGLCVRCNDVFPVAVAAVEDTDDDGSHDDDSTDDGKPAGQNEPKRFLGLDLPQHDKPLKLFGVTVLRENRSGS